VTVLVWFILLLVIVLLIVVGVYLWTTYNGLVRGNVRVNEAWSDVTVQLRRRADLIPNLVETVKGYAAHESEVLADVTKARSEVLAAEGPADSAAADDHMQAALQGVLAVAESYPQLQASQNFLRLQTELVDTEDKIQASRRFYNGAVRDLNSRIQVFPNTIVARRIGLKTRQFFDAPEGTIDPDPPAVEFGSPAAPAVSPPVAG